MNIKNLPPSLRKRAVERRRGTYPVVYNPSLTQEPRDHPPAIVPLRETIEDFITRQGRWMEGVSDTPFSSVIEHDDDLYYSGPSDDILPLEDW